MIEILFKCHICYSINVVRNSYNVLKIGVKSYKYKCKDCGCCRVIEYIKKRYNDKEKDLLIKLHNHRLSLRSIKKLFGVKVDTVISWIRKRACNLPDLFHNSIPPAKLGEIVELDEVWSFIYSKSHVRYIWIGISRLTKLVFAYYIGDRTNESCKEFKSRIPYSYKYNTTIHTDMHKPYITYFKDFKHMYQPTKKETNLIEAFNSILRARLSTMIRKIKSYAKTEDMFEARLKIFVHQYNQELIEKM